MKLLVGRKYRFEAAHTLPWHEGKCSRVHGHSYVLEVRVEGTRDQRGVVVEFGELDALVERRVISRIDHQDLNRVLDNPTAENLIFWIAAQLEDSDWSHLSLWETENGWVELVR